MLAKNNGIDLLSLALILRQNTEGANVDAVARQLAQTAQNTADGAVTAAGNAQTAAGNAQSTADSAVSGIAALTTVVNGKSDKATVIQTSDSVISLTLADNTILQCGTVTAVNVTLGNGTYTDGYVVDISFTSGTTATNWNVLAPLFTGTDCEDNVFVPQPSKRYNVTMFWDGSYIVGLVVGNEITIS